MLYATPESTPLPDSPTSLLPPLSPYVINHKRRGPRLFKSLSDKHVIERKVDEVDARLYNNHFRRLSEERENALREQHKERSNNEALLNANNDSSMGSDGLKEESGNDSGGDKVGGNAELKILTGQGFNRDDGEAEDFYDPQEGMSYMSYTDGEDYGAGDQSARMYTPLADFYDAWEGKILDYSYTYFVPFRLV